MKVALLTALGLAAAVQGGSTQKTAPTSSTFTEPYVGLQFTHPVSWKVIKKQKDRTIMSVPIPETADAALLEIDRTQFHKEKDLWQTIQLRINEQLKRTVTRQWEQEVLGVPMLLTRIDYVDKGSATAALTGLFFSNTEQKLLLRLTAPRDSFDKAEFELDSALQSLRTVDGSLPKADDPNVKLEVPKKLEPVPPGPKLLDSPTSQMAKLIYAPQKIALTVSTKKVILRIPAGWIAKSSGDNTVTLTHAGLGAPVALSLYSDLDSDPPASALDNAAAEMLSQYQVGPDRVDSGPDPNRAGSTVSTVWRTGKAVPTGDMASFEGVCQSGDFYFVAKYKQANVLAYKADRVLIKQLMDTSSIEPAP